MTPNLLQVEGGEKTEYRVWNPFRSKLAAAVLAGVDNIHIKPGAKARARGRGSPAAAARTCAARTALF